MDLGFLLLPALLALVAGSAIGCRSNSPEYSISFYNDSPAVITAAKKKGQRRKSPLNAIK